MLTARSASHSDDTGVIAIVVALSISTFLLGFAALAVDLGSAYTRKAELQSIADRLAVAGAVGLPDTGAAFSRMLQTVQGICDDDPTPGICPPTGAPNLNWATDGDPDNGRIDFYADPDGDGRINPADLVTDLASSNAVALQITLPPSTVQFGLASAIGFSTVDVHKSASARVGTPLGSGILPFAVTSADVAGGQFCAVDRAGSPPPPHSTPVPTRFGRIAITTVLTPNHADAQAATDGGVTTSVQLQPSGFGTGQFRGVNIFFSNHTGSVTSFPAQTNTNTFVPVPVPPGEATDRAQVWATGQIQVRGRLPGGGFGLRFQSFTSLPTTFTYDGIPDTTPDLCTQPQSVDRGHVELARNDSASDPLAANVRTGPQVHLFPYSPVGAILGQIDDPCVTATFSSGTSCLTSVSDPSFGDSLHDGLLSSSGNQPGRLIGNCSDDGNGTDSNGVDRTRLLTDGSPLIDTNEGGTASLLLSNLLGGVLPTDDSHRGWVKSQALKCPRLAVVPVVDSTPLGSLPGPQLPIQKFVYAWIDDPTTRRGLTMNGGAVYSLRGYLLDPRYLPAITSGSPVVGPLLGGDMPKEAILIHNLGGLTP
jgi:Putative Flp pilus-assembly TadE/G-like